MSENNQPQGQAQNAPIKKPWYTKWWVITIGVVVLLVIIGNSGKDKNKDSSKQTAQEEKSETSAKKAEQPAVPEVTVTSMDLSKEYSENEVAADAKYKGKIIEVSGKITAIDNGIADNQIIIRLSDGVYDINTTWCYMNESERDKAIALKKDQQVTLTGKGDSATMKSPVLKECTIK